MFSDAPMSTISLWSMEFPNVESVPTEYVPTSGKPEGKNIAILNITASIPYVER